MKSMCSEDLGLRYLHVAHSLRTQILDGTYQPGQRLPRQHDLAKELKVALITLTYGLNILEREGYVVRKVGRGTYASLPEEHAPVALVVDDEDNVREFLAEALAHWGWRSVAAKSGVGALKQFRGQKFDLVILDLGMVGKSGAETFQEIREMDPATNVVIITAYPKSDQMWEALKIGPFAIMRKPITLEELGRVLNNGAIS